MCVCGVSEGIDITSRRYDGILAQSGKLLVVNSESDRFASLSKQQSLIAGSIWYWHLLFLQLKYTRGKVN